MPTMTMIPMNDSMLSVVPVASRTATTPISPIGTANMMMNGIEERPELRDHHQVEQHHRHAEAEAEAGERRLHRGHRPAEASP